MTARSTSLQVVPASTDGPPPGRTAPGAAQRAAWPLGALGVLVAFALVLLHGTSESRAIQRLPVAERAALYHRTVDTLRTVCADEGKRDLRDLCRAQAQLALLFPECDAACQATAREQLRTPTR